MPMTIDEVTENRSSLEQHIFTWCTTFLFLLNTREDCVLGYLLQFFYVKYLLSKDYKTDETTQFS
jgi:hypothetical protein